MHHSKTGFLFVLTVTACAAGCSQAAVDGGSARNQAPATHDEASSAVAAKPAADVLPDGYVRVPGGVMAHPDCIHQIPSGAKVDVDDDVTLDGKLIGHFEKCGHPIRFSRRPHETADRRAPAGTKAPDPGPAPGGWVAASEANAPTNQQFVSSDSTFIVPSAPATQKDTALSSAGQTVFLFPSIQTASGSAIVQPVLEWGPGGGTGGGVTAGSGFGGNANAIGSTSSWTYAAYGVTPTSVYHGPGITVNAGDTLEAQMIATSQTSSVAGWEVIATDKTTGATDWMIVDFSTAELWSNAEAGALEVYNISQCSDFPGGNPFTVFKYPTLEQATFGSPFGSKTTTISPSSSIWVDDTYLNGGINSTYTGPNCGFDATIGNTQYGTTIQY
jgi:hypothetical protein